MSPLPLHLHLTGAALVVLLLLATSSTATSHAAAAAREPLLLFALAEEAAPTPPPALGEEQGGGDADICDQASSVDASQRCAFVLANCPQDGLINYMYLYYCSPIGSVAACILLILWLSLLLILLATTADSYFCPPLTHLADGFNFSPRLAGCTLLALGNGSPDIFSTIAALEEDDPSQPLKQRSLQLSLGALSGAGMFVTAVVFGAVLLVARGTHARGAFLRDIIAYIIVVVGSFTIFALTKMSYWQPIVFLVFYVGYVATVALSDHYATRQRNAATKEKSHHDDHCHQEVTNDETSSLLHPAASDPHLPHLTSQCGMDPVDPDEEIEQEGEELLRRTHAPAARWKVMIQKAWNEAGVFGKVVMVLESPFSVLRTITVPMGDSAHWHRYTCSISVCLFPLFLTGYLYKAHGVNMFVGPVPAPVISLCVGLPLGAKVLYSSRNESPPPFHLAIGILGFISAAMWMDVVADEVVVVLTVLGQVFKVSNDVMGLTVLAWANSIGDLVADIAIARKGRANMATTACFAGPLFNMLVGLGVGLLAVLPSREIPYSAGVTGANILTYCFLLSSLLCSLTVSIVMKQHIPRRHGFLLIGLYLLFAVFTFLNQFGVLHVPDVQS